MTRITTVRGDISPEQLGFTSMHDHTLGDASTAGKYATKQLFSIEESEGIPAEMLTLKPENYGFLRTGAYMVNPDFWVLDDVDAVAKELGYFKAIGGNSIVDPDPIGIRGNIEDIRLLSEKTGINIICATGMYHEMAIDEKYKGRDEDYFYNLFKGEIENGIDGTDIHPGVLKAALAAGSKTEEAALMACVHLTKETGMMTYVHTDALDDETTINMIETAVKKYDVDRSRINVCHIDSAISGGVSVNDYLFNPEVDRTIDLSTAKTLLEKGYNIGLDGWGMPISPPGYFLPDDYDRLKALITLLDLGYGKQLTLGNDFGQIMTYRANGGYGCTRFAEFGLQMLSSFGREEDVKMLAYENPARLLAY